MSAFAPFRPSDHLDDPVVIAEYLVACLEDPNPDVFLAALADVAEAKGGKDSAVDIVGRFPGSCGEGSG